jgi:hypothetical protein
VIAVDMYGQCADYDRLLTACDRYGVPLIEDAAEALGASLPRPRGGVVRAGRSALLQRQQDRHHRRRRHAGDRRRRVATQTRHLATQAREPVPHYEHRAVGYNYRLSNLLAAVGRARWGGCPTGSPPAARRPLLPRRLGACRA